MKQAELVKKMTDRELLLNLYSTQLIIFIVTGLMGWFLFESWQDFFLLFKWQPYEIFVYGFGSAIIIVIFELIIEKRLPKSMFDDGGINERVFQNRGIFHILILAIMVSLAEELLFRGVIQTHFGIIVASLLFAVIHFRYLYKPALFIVTIILSFYLGWLYLTTGNILVPIAAHFTIDFILGCILSFRKKENYV